MYTQCPGCDTAFRVTATVLQQAAGRVRCGRCGAVFNALERLSEGLPQPEQPPAPDDAGALLRKLEELAGPDEVRIEDTGVEWRVVDDEAFEEADADEAAAPGEDTGRSSVRWYFDDDAGHDSGNDPQARTADESATADDPAAQRALSLPRRDDDGELRFDDNTPLPDDFLDEPEEEEVPRRRAEDLIEPRAPEFDERQVDLALGDAGDWLELLDEVGEDADPAAGEEAPAPETARPDPGISETGGADDAAAPVDLEDTNVRPALTAAGEEAAARPLPDDIDTQFDLQALALGIEVSARHRLADAVPDEAAAAAPDDQAAAREGSAADDVRPDEPAAAPPAEAPAAAPPAGETAGDDEDDDALDRLIDRDLLRYTDERYALAAASATPAPAGDAAPLFETIIMEGETIRHESAAADASLAETADESDGNAAAAFQPGAQEAWRAEPKHVRPPVDRRAVGMAAAVALLALALLAQAVHAHRETIAAGGAFGGVVEAVYRAAGSTIVPNWNVRGWEFLSTRGRADESGEILRVTSRLVNRSGRPLPYPLMHLSLTDRWEEVVGSTVLEPAAYLGRNVNRQQRVSPGEGFEARIAVPALPAEAAGYKLNVCYRTGGGKLRCALDDFGN